MLVGILQKMAMEMLHDFGGVRRVSHTGFDHHRVLHDHRVHHLE